MTVEGEKDDISGLGQTEATHALCSSIPDHRRVHYVQKGVGHYGVFNGSRFRSEIVPRISDFMLSAASTEACAGRGGGINARSNRDERVRGSHRDAALIRRDR